MDRKEHILTWTNIQAQKIEKSGMIYFIKYNSPKLYE